MTDTVATPRIASPEAAGEAEIPAGPEVTEERRTSSTELLWDLVFVFAVTQVTTLLSHRLSWAGFGRAMLVLALIWWAWSAFVWAANAQASDSRALRIALLAATALIFITGLSVPEAFGSAALLFAVTYTIVRLLHLVVYADASRRGNAAWSAIAGFALTVSVGMALLLAGAALHGTARIVLWCAAVAIDYAGPGWLTRKKLRSLQRVAVAHFAERYGLFVIICLGESIVAIGVGASTAQHRLSAELVATVSFGLIATVAMWWTYFDRFAEAAERRLRAHADPVLAAADSYSYIHLAIVAGIITFAAGVRLLVRAPAALPSDAVRLALCGGVGCYLLGHIGFRMRLLGQFGTEKAAVVVALAILFAAGGGLAGWALVLAIAALLSAMCVVETVFGRGAENERGEAGEDSMGGFRG